MSTAGLDLRSWPARLGVPEGATVQLMADLTRMAWHARRSGQRFDPVVLLDAFVQHVGPSGTVLVPTYTFDLRDGAAFDVRRTPSISGALAQAALGHAVFRRTPHPLHSFAVAGAGADELVRADERSSFGPGSPFAFLRKHHGLLVAIDLPLDDALTYVHHVEETTGVPYRRHRAMIFRYTGADGTTGEREFTLYAKRPGHHMAFGPLQPLLEQAGCLTTQTLDGAKVLCVDLAAAHAVIADDIQRNKARSIHRFTWKWWGRDVLRQLLRTFDARRPGAG